MTYVWLGQPRRSRGRLCSAASRCGGWAEEVYESKVALARIATARGSPWPTIEARWLEAHAFAPHRAEPLHAIASHYDALGQHALTFLFARRGYELPLPLRDSLFVDEEVYTWKLADLVGASAYWLGEYAIGEAAATGRPRSEGPATSGSPRTSASIWIIEALGARLTGAGTAERAGRARISTTPGTVHEAGVEPACLAAPEPKSGAYASSATRASEPER